VTSETNQDGAICSSDNHSCIDNHDFPSCHVTQIGLRTWTIHQAYGGAVDYDSGS
jgi:hypothetical protein